MSTGRQVLVENATSPGICWDCGGPCRTQKGTVHGWRCEACCARYMADGAAAADAADAKDRADRLNLVHANNIRRRRR